MKRLQFQILALWAMTVSAALFGESRWTDADSFLAARQLDLTAAVSGRTYRLWVSVPEGPPPADGFPVLYVLDGHVSFPLAALIARERSERGQVLGFAPGIVVGIVHLKSEADPNPRAEDFTPPAADLSDTGDTLAERQGGADRFLDFLEGEVKPAVMSAFPIDRKRQALFGHSYGGLFVLHTLFTRPESFQRYIAASPSIWWNHRFILGERDTFLATKLPSLRHDGRAPRLLLAVGSLEQTPLPHHVAAGRASMMVERRMIDNARELALEFDRAGLPCRWLLLEGENHGTARVPALNHAIRAAFGE